MRTRITYQHLKAKAASLLTALLLCTGAQAQFDATYKPLEAGASIPAEYIIDIESASRKSAEGVTILDKKTAKNYFSDLFYAKKQIFDAGDVYLPNALTRYVDSIFAALLKTEPSLKEKFKIYVTRYSSPNAFCLADGSVFINVGLIKELENESELAFVISHEIAHLALQHSIKDFAKNIEIKKKESANSSWYSNAFRKLRFSRESELEADGYALSLMTAAGFETSMAVEALSKLKHGRKTREIDFEKSFNNSFFTLDTAIHLKTLLKNVKEVVKSRQHNNADSKLDDLYETHPDMDKRIASVNELMRNIKPVTTKRPAAAYNYYNTLASFEVTYNNFREQDYINALINSLLLQDRYPDNTYLMANVARSLYWISYFKEVGKDNDLLVYGDLNQNTESYYEFYVVFNRMSLKECKQLAYAYLRAREEKTGSAEALVFYLSLSAENYLGKTGSYDFYRSYLNKFPNGTYSAFVKTKLK